MKRTSRISDLRDIITEEKKRGRKIAFVPTMGFLHHGHLTLIDQAKKTGAFLVVSIFVNPLQFGPNEDLTRYPRDIERDALLVEGVGVDVLFHPTVEEMYPDKMITFVEVGELDAMLCGANRPGHFRGVATVVNKLFNIVQPDMAFFGQKDYQQYLIIKRMVNDLNLPIQICLVPIVREDDGLAMSSRNIFLNPDQRQEALILSKSLNEAERSIKMGKKSAREIEEQIKESITIESQGVIDYVEVRDASDLTEVTDIKQPVLIALAVKFGTTRLIDNKVVEVKHDV